MFSELCQHQPRGLSAPAAAAAAVAIPRYPLAPAALGAGAAARGPSAGGCRPCRASPGRAGPVPPLRSGAAPSRRTGAHPRSPGRSLPAAQRGRGSTFCSAERRRVSVKPSPSCCNPLPQASAAALGQSRCKAATSQAPRSAGRTGRSPGVLWMPLPVLSRLLAADSVRQQEDAQCSSLGQLSLPRAPRAASGLWLDLHTRRPRCLSTIPIPAAGCGLLLLHGISLLGCKQQKVEVLPAQESAKLILTASRFGTDRVGTSDPVKATGFSSASQSSAEWELWDPNKALNASVTFGFRLAEPSSPGLLCLVEIS